ncbi:MAG: DUF3667 domain-containing protein [Bacteroidota bacterium]
MSLRPPKLKATPPERITMRHIGGRILASFDLEKGLLYTFWSLTVAPGKALREYLFEDRSRMVKPMRLLLLMVAISTLVSLQVVSNVNGAETPEMIPVDALPELWKENATSLNALFLKYFNVLQLLKVPLYALATFWFFKKQQYFFAEHLVINAYIFSYQSFWITVLLPVILLSSKLGIGLVTLFLFGYITFVFIQLFGDRPFVSFLKCVAVYTVTNILHAVLVFGIVLLLLATGVIT